MAFESAKTSLAFIEEKFIKLLQLAGKVNASFEASIKPVLVMGDTRDPGVASFRGRRFAVASGGLAIGGTANATVPIRFGVPVIVEQLYVGGIWTGASGGHFEFHLLPPEFIASGVGVPWAVPTSPVGTWIDQRTKFQDPPPIFSTLLMGQQINNAANFAALSDSTRLWRGVGFASTAATPPGVMYGVPSINFGYGIHVPAESQIHLNAQLVGAGSVVSLGLVGRIF